jgi:hypothetical protein
MSAWDDLPESTEPATNTSPPDLNLGRRSKLKPHGKPKPTQAGSASAPVTTPPQTTAVPPHGAAAPTPAGPASIDQELEELLDLELSKPVKPGPPAQKYVPEAERVARRRSMAALMVQRVGREERTLAMAKAHPGITQREVRELFRELSHELTEDQAELDPTNKRAAELRLLGHIRKASTHDPTKGLRPNWTAVAQFEKTLAEVQGTLAPEQVQVNLSVQLAQAQALVIGDLGPDDMARLIQEEARRSGLLGPAPVVVEAEGVDAGAHGHEDELSRAG